MGSRYGVRTRKRFREVQKIERQKHDCPRCGKKRVKRIGNALWRCSACGTEFAGGAYAPATTVGESARKVIGAIKQVGE
jgi:large subunit ribosomal protein L37Ae